MDYLETTPAAIYWLRTCIVMRSNGSKRLRDGGHKFTGTYAPVNDAREYTFSAYWFSSGDNLVWRAQLYRDGNPVGHRDGRIKGVAPRSHDSSLVQAEIERVIEDLRDEIVMREER